MPDALARMEALLPELFDAGSEGASLWRFLPDAECLASADLARRDAVPDPALLRRSAVASTLVAGLEFARQGRITRAQEGFGVITVHGASSVAAPGAEAGSGDGS